MPFAMICIFMPPTSKKLTGHIDFWLCVRVYIWIPHGKLADTLFFLSEFSPFLESCPFGKIRMKSDACHILCTVHARVLKFYIWILHGKIADPYFFVRVISLSGVMPL